MNAAAVTTAAIRREMVDQVKTDPQKISEPREKFSFVNMITPNPVKTEPKASIVPKIPQVDVGEPKKKMSLLNILTVTLPQIELGAPFRAPEKAPDESSTLALRKTASANQVNGMQEEGTKSARKTSLISTLKNPTPSKKLSLMEAGISKGPAVARKCSSWESLKKRAPVTSDRKISIVDTVAERLPELNRKKSAAISLRSRKGSLLDVVTENLPVTDDRKVSSESVEVKEANGRDETMPSKAPQRKMATLQWNHQIYSRLDRQVSEPVCSYTEDEDLSGIFEALKKAEESDSEVEE